MGQDRRKRLGIVVGLGLAVVVLASTLVIAFKASPKRPASGPVPSAADREAGAKLDLAKLHRGDPAVVAALRGEAVVDPKSNKPRGLTEAEGVAWLDRLNALRAGYLKLPAAAKVDAQAATAGILARFAIEGCPSGWSAILAPCFDLLTAGLNDPRPDVRIAALDQVATLWIWSPGGPMTPAEEKAVADWKESLHTLVVRRLADPEAPLKQHAIACLATLPIDSKAAPALPYLQDPNFSVRLAVLTHFAPRPMLLTEEAILPLLHDPVPDLAALAERILRARGLDPDLVGLGRMVTHKRPEMRASAIPILLKRDDIDPVVWLLRLSEDSDEMVRLKAVGALSGRTSPEITQRLREMAAADDSPAVRAAALKLLPADTTVALPPLPGSPSLNPRAN